jgi:hypothetical protein
VRNGSQLLSGRHQHLIQRLGERGGVEVIVEELQEVAAPFFLLDFVVFV